MIFLKLKSLKQSLEAPGPSKLVQVSRGGVLWPLPCWPEWEVAVHVVCWELQEETEELQEELRLQLKYCPGYVCM